MPILVIPDLHAPVTHPGAFDFIDHVAQKTQPDRVVFIGDIVDHHGISAWTKHPAAPGPKDEYEMSLEQVQKWYEAYPKAVVTKGNHDVRPMRMASQAGVPGSYLRDFKEVWQTPGWDWVGEATIDDVYFTHSGGAGENPAFTLAKKMAMSCCVGHAHTVGGCRWLANPIKRWFSMDVGCLLDHRLYAFAYSKAHKKKPILGCGVIDPFDPMETRFVAMPCDRGERFDRRRYPEHPLLVGRTA